jgi:hypothetical protein
VSLARPMDGVAATRDSEVRAGLCLGPAHLHPPTSSSHGEVEGKSYGVDNHHPLHRTHRPTVLIPGTPFHLDSFFTR